jgi:D-aminopeptidase
MSVPNNSLAPIIPRIGQLSSGPHDAITDVAGVRVGHVTISRDSPDIVRTGISVVYPLAEDYLESSVFAGFHRFNGFGEFCGAQWIAETGLLTSPIFLTSSYSVGVVRDSVMMDPARRGQMRRFHHPCIGETNYVTPADVQEAMRRATAGPMEQGAVGGGTGMICHGFKGGIGTASRVVMNQDSAVTVGVLVQTNHGQRIDLRYDGAPVGRLIGPDQVPAPKRTDDGSIVVVVACDAPLLPDQCQRLAQRAVLGIGRTGGLGQNFSGDFVLAFSTGNRVPAIARSTTCGLSMFPNELLSPVFAAVVEATEAAIFNSMLHALDTTGRRGSKVWALTPMQLAESLRASRAFEPGDSRA